MTSVEELKAGLTALDTAYVEKTGNQPRIGASLNLRQSMESWECRICRTFGSVSDEWLRAHGETPDGAILAMAEDIAALPSMEALRMQEFQRDLGKLIDKGREYDIPVTFLNPLAETARELAENALTHEAAE